MRTIQGDEDYAWYEQYARHDEANAENAKENG